MNYLLEVETLYFSCFSYIILFCCAENIRLNSMHYFIMKFPNRCQLQQLVFNHSSDIGFKGLMNLYKKCTAKHYPFLVIDATLTSDNPSRFRENLLETI